MSHIIRELLEAVVLALVVFFVIQISVKNFRVEGHSMKPTLDGGEYLMVSKLPYLRVDMQRLSNLVPFWQVDEPRRKYLPFAHPPDRGDVIVFRAPTKPLKDFVKRVVGLPGERVEVRTGAIYIDGARLEEDYLSTTTFRGSMDCIPNSINCRLQPDRYFVLGDNRASSNDSRDWGPVPLENIVGKVWFVYWPFNKLPFLETLKDGE